MPLLPPEIEEIAAVVKQHVRPVIAHGLKVSLMLREIGCRAADEGYALPRRRSTAESCVVFRLPVETTRAPPFCNVMSSATVFGSR